MIDDVVARLPEICGPITSDCTAFGNVSGHHSSFQHQFANFLCSCDDPSMDLDLSVYGTSGMNIEIGSFKPLPAITTDPVNMLQVRQEPTTRLITY